MDVRRKPGFYWVQFRRGDRWVVAQWRVYDGEASHEAVWLWPGYEVPSVEEPYAVDERRLIRSKA